jgi:phosphatidate cytidylyltransferase
MNNLTLRILTALVAGPLFVLCLWLGPWGPKILIGGLMVLGAYEFERLISARFSEAKHFGMFWAVFAAFGYALIGALELDNAVVWFWTACVALGWIIEAFRALDVEKLFPWLALQVCGSLFLGSWFAQSFHLIEAKGTGFEPVLPFLFVLLCMWIVDTGAYFCGRSFGKRPLAPVLSPKKTLEGAIGGTLLTIAFGAWAGPAMLDLAWYWTAGLALVLAITGQVGDLLESAVKRWAGIKDSSNLLPGHGGFLDRFDSFYLSAPVAAILLRLIGV